LVEKVEFFERINHENERIGSFLRASFILCLGTIVFHAGSTIADGELPDRK
jgi:hypothetical protein